MIDVIMPKMGESITEGTILEWKKKIGDSVDKDETILEISTDKVDSEVPSPAAGILIEIIANVNDVVPVGNVIARIGDADEKSIIGDLDKKAPEPFIKEREIEAEDSSILDENDLHIEENNKDKKNERSSRFYSPLVKSIAKKENVSFEELDAMAGSGKNGRVNKKDLLNYLENRSLSVSSENNLDSVISKSLSDKVEPMSRMRKKIADHMVASVNTSPHVYTTVEADVTNLVAIRNDYQDEFKNRSGVTLTYTPMILDACIRSIQEFPLMNASLQDYNIIHHEKVNMGVAVALPDDNLIVPVINASEEKNFLGLARSTSDLASRARKNELLPEEIFGSTFTVTNPGVFGGLFGMGIINQPNVGILAVGSIQKRPVVKETEYGDSIIIRHMVYLTLSYDHRIIDGAYGTRFLSHLVGEIENYDIQRIKG
tara:strand:- start:2060 stop:3346 length:1287 start_codon:yes stop_codon:yes gene_type:complete